MCKSVICNAAVWDSLLSSAPREPQCELNIKLWSDSISRSGYDVWRKAALRYSKIHWRLPSVLLMYKTLNNCHLKNTHEWVTKAYVRQILRQLAKIIHATPSQISEMRLTTPYIQFAYVLYTTFIFIFF